jgi:serine/threonine-protein kinase HipA
MIHPAPMQAFSGPVAPPHRRGIVRLSGQRVGSIEETAGGTRFTYNRDWVARSDAVPISLTLPLREEPYSSKGLHPFFENLLPEGWLLEISTTSLKIPKDDAFGLLLATAADCVGAVEIVPEEQVSQAR